MSRSTWDPAPPPPPTRYQGSKRRLLPWLSDIFADLEFDSALDLFSGTASVAHLLKSMGKQVVCNDYLQSNYLTAVALVQNESVRCDTQLLGELTVRRPGAVYDDFIARTYRDVYYTDEENRWLDCAAQNLACIVPLERRALAAHALFQACLAKRPYNLFHRANLYMREAKVERSFGNKTTWDTPFESLLSKAAAAASSSVFAGQAPCLAHCGEAFAVAATTDLVYADPPYVSGRGSAADYFQLYHFLEGLACYQQWPDRVDHTRKHLPMTAGERSPWSDPHQVRKAFEQLMERFKGCTMVISYRSDGQPSIEDLQRMMQRHKRQVQVHTYGDYQYALSTNRSSREVALVGVG